MNKYSINCDYIFNIIVVGHYNVGKSCTIVRYCENRFTGDPKEIGAKIISVYNHQCQLFVWDYPYRRRDFYEKYSPIPYYRSCHGVIFIYDITDIGSFNKIKGYYYEEYCKHRLDNRDNIKEIKNNFAYDYSTYSPQILILGTKSDLRNQSNYNSCVDFDQVREYAKSINALSFEVSSKENIGIDESIDEMISSLLPNYIKANGKKRNEINSTPSSSSSSSLTSSTSSLCTIN